MGPSLWIWPGMIPILALPGEMRPGQFGPMSRLGRRRHEDQRAVGARGLDGVLDGIPDGKAFVRRPPLARCDAADDLRPVFLAAERVEGAFLAGDALHENLRRLVDQDAHLSRLNVTDLGLRLDLFGPLALIGCLA